MPPERKATKQPSEDSEGSDCDDQRIVLSVKRKTTKQPLKNSDCSDFDEQSMGGRKRIPLLVDESSADEDDLPEFGRKRKQNLRSLKMQFAELLETKKKLEEMFTEERTKKNVSLKRKRSESSVAMKIKFNFRETPRKSARLGSRTPVDFKNLFSDEVEIRTRTTVPKQRAVLKVYSKRDTFDLSGINKMLSDNPPDFFGFPKNHRSNASELKKIIHKFDSVPEGPPVTQKMLDNIAFTSTNKMYDKVTGTSCHQCRQKTIDTKSICRWPLCTGVKGQFCGFCLWNRYGENLRKVLLDTNWKCPCCRCLCNCSICRTKDGKIPTGIMAHTAKAKGYKSVLHMLIREGDDHKCSSDDLPSTTTFDEQKKETVPDVFAFLEKEYPKAKRAEQLSKIIELLEKLPPKKKLTVKLKAKRDLIQRAMTD